MKAIAICLLLLLSTSVTSAGKRPKTPKTPKQAPSSHVAYAGYTEVERTACSLQPPAAVTAAVLTTLDCQGLCDAARDCTGFDFNPKKKVCTTHNQPIAHVAINTNKRHNKRHASCYKKDCVVANVTLNEYESWQKEAGFWVGEYSFYNGDGDAYTSANWNYPYLHYKGFIKIELNGDCLKQRNVFLYPPQDPSVCASSNSDVVGTGACGVNGQEKVFAADQCASDCDGNLAGPYVQAGFSLDTFTSLVGGFNDAVLYQVRAPAFLGGGLIQNQITTLPRPGKRIRTAHSLDFITGEINAASFYRETRVTEAEFNAALAATRTEYTIQPVDNCAWINNLTPSGVDCATHFA